MLSISRVLSVIFCGLLASKAFAVGELAQSFTLDGQLTQAGNDQPLLDSSAKIVIQILDPSKNCLLYEEQQFVDTSASNGYYNIQVGSALGAAKRTVNDPGRTMVQIYQNTGGIAANSVPGHTCAGGTYTPTAADSRYFRMIVTPSATGVADTLSPDTTMDSVASALVAQTLQGYSPSQFLQVGTGDLTQTNLQTVFATGNATKLTSLLSVNPSNYVTKDATNGTIQIPGTTAPSSPQIGQIWYDSGVLKYWNGSEQTLGVGTGVTSVVAGTGLNVGAGPGGTITSTGTLNVDAGTNAGQIVQVQTGGKLPALDGSNLTNLNGSAIQSGTIGGSTAISTSGNLQTSQDVTAKRLFMQDNGSNFVGLKAPTAVTTTYSLTFPAAQGGANTMLLNDGSGNLSWVAQNTGSVTSVTGSSPINITGTASAPVVGITKADATHDGYLAQGDWTTFNNKLSTTLTSANLWVGNGSNVATAVAPGGDVTMDNTGAFSVAKVKGTTVSATPTTAGQVLRYDGTNYTPGFVAMTDLRSTVTGTNQFASSCSSNQTLTYNSVGDVMSCQNIAVSDSQVTFGSKSANTVLAAPNGSAGAPSFRTLVAADIPGLDWTKIISGTPTTLAGYGITDSLVANSGGTPSIKTGLDASKGSGGSAGLIYVASDTFKIYRDNGSGFDLLAQASGAAPGGSAGGDLTGTFPNPTLTTTTVTNGTYGSATQVATFTVDTKGRLTAAGNTSIALPWSAITSGTPTTLAGYGITDSLIANGGGTPAIQSGADASKPLTPAAGTIYFATDNNIIYQYNSGAWAVIAQASGAAPGGSAGGDLTGTYPNPTLATTAVTNGSYGSATQVPTFTVDTKGRLTAAANVTITGVAPGGSASGDLSGSYPGPTVAKLQNIGVSATAPTTAGQVLRYDGSVWKPNFVAMTDLRSTVTGSNQFGASCTSGQTLTYNSVGDVMSCQNISVGASNFSSQTANTFLAAPNGSAGTPTFRTIAGADLPNPSATTLGGVQSIASQSSKWINSISTSGVPSLSQPAFSDISGSVDLTSQVTGTLPENKGGTGVTSLGSAAVLKGGQAGAITLGPSDANALTLNTSGTARMTILSGGNVGVGTTSPGGKMEISGPDWDKPALIVKHPGYGANAVQIQAPAWDTVALPYYSNLSITPPAATSTTTQTQTAGLALGSNFWTGTTSSPGTALLFNRRTSATVMGYSLIFHMSDLSGGADRMALTAGGNLGIGTTSPSNTLHVVGSLCVKSAGGNCAGNTAGTIYATTTSISAADLAEHMPISDETLAAGDVVVIDRMVTSTEAEFSRSSKAYQSNAIGVVSSAPGVALGSETKLSRPIALAGRVPVNVTLEGGPIAVGDYLVASSTPGRAMKAKGATSSGVIGIALSAYDGNAIPAKDWGDGIAHAQGHQVLMFVQVGANSQAGFAELKAENTALKSEVSGMKQWICSKDPSASICK